MAMLNQATPILFVYGAKYATMTEIELENLLPFAFLYGIGTSKRKRPNRVSIQACIHRYMRLAVMQFMRGDVILVSVCECSQSYTVRTFQLQYKCPSW